MGRRDVKWKGRIGEEEAALVLAEIVSMMFEVRNSPIRLQRIRITHTHNPAPKEIEARSEEEGMERERGMVMRSESGSEFWRDGRKQGGAASTLVTAAEILSTGGKGR